MKELSIKEQIRVLELASQFQFQTPDMGMCHCIKKAIIELTPAIIGYGQIKELIPSFNIETMIELAIAYDFELPDKTHAYWWNFSRNGVDSRLFAFDALIKELELCQNTSATSAVK